MLHLPPFAQHRHLTLGHREPEIARLRVPGIGAGLITEAEKLLTREEREPHIDRRRVLRPESARRPPRAPFAGPNGSVEHHDIADAPRGEVPGDARAHDTAAHDGD